MVDIGRNAMYFDDYVLSIQYFNRAIKAKPYLARPYFYRAIAKLNLDDFIGAESDASEALRINPYLTDAWEVRGVARQNSGKTAEAIEDYRHALSLLPQNRQITYNMAAALVDEKRYDEADSALSALLTRYPKFENGYLGRARLNLERGDTIAAIADIDTTLKINPESFNGHTLRADVALRGGVTQRDTALYHLNRAIRLQPRLAGLYVNRAYLMYLSDDWFSAMSDYDTALAMDPLNEQALFNRGLLEIEAGAMDKALDDFTAVLKLDPENLHARYNRSVALAEKHRYDEAIADINHVIDADPSFPSGYWMRSDYNRARGNHKDAAADRKRAMALTDALEPDSQGRVGKAAENASASQNNSEKNAAPESPENIAAKKEHDTQMAARRFAGLLTVDDNTDMRNEYNNSAIRGRIQDKNVQIQPEPPYELTYYANSSELSTSNNYIKEVNDINDSRRLNNIILVSNSTPGALPEEQVEKHFRSVEYYNSYLGTHPGSTIDFIGRAMDFLTVHNYDAAIVDLNRAIALSPNFAPAYMLRAQANYRKMLTLSDDGNSAEPLAAVSTTGLSASSTTSAPRAISSSESLRIRRHALSQDILDDISYAIDLTPRNPYLWFNKGYMLAENGRNDEAEQAYSKAIELKPDMGTAYFNRGFLMLSAGNRSDGISDLSKAGEYGVVQAYNLIKRITP